MTSKYTLASLAWRKRQRNHRLLFGTPDRFVRINWQTRFAAFRPGVIFGYERWRANKYGTIEWQVFVLQAQDTAQSVSKIPGIFPGAICLVSAHGKQNTKRLFLAFDKLQLRQDLSSLSAEFWFKFGVLFKAGFQPSDLIEMSG